MSRPITTILLFFSLTLQGQKSINLKNPSFEDKIKCCDPPIGWYNCGPSEESPTDVQPGMFQVTLPASDGSTYLGMVVRDNNTVEAVGQRLSEPLVAGKRYRLNVALARSEIYLSYSRITGKEANFATPVLLRVWGSSRGKCDKDEMLYQTPLITTTHWKDYELILEPQKANCTYLILEASYSTQTPEALSYNGNLLLDNLSLQALEY